MATGVAVNAPYPRYNETVEGVVASPRSGPRRNQPVSPTPMPARTLCARGRTPWIAPGIRGKRAGKPVWQLALLQQPRPMTTAYTLSLDTPEAMAKAASEASHRPLLNLKLGRDGDVERLRLIRAAAPTSRLIIDANEGWTPAELPQLLKACAAVGVELVEQPLHVADDETLLRITHDVPICADESAHDRRSLHKLVGKYDAINIKLDKTGGLTEALALAQAAKELNFKIMVGCMIATSLAMAPAACGPLAQVIDLDVPCFGPIATRAFRCSHVPAGTRSGLTCFRAKASQRRKRHRCHHQIGSAQKLARACPIPPSSRRRYRPKTEDSLGGAGI
jgi:hypothetical protein